jgi:hypothetical protein
MIALLLHASWVGLGLLVLFRLEGSRDWPPLLAVPLGYFTGALLHVLALHGLLLTHASLAPLVWGLIGAGLVALPSGLRGLRAQGAGATPGPSSSTAGRAQGFLDLVLALALLPPAALIALQLVGLPDVDYDSVAFWNLKSAWLFHGERLHDPVFTDALRVHANPDYPLYRPIFALEHYVLLGAADDYASKPGFALQLLMGLTLLYALLRDGAGRTAALLALALLLWTPIMAAASISGSPGTTLVDFPLGLQFAASLGLSLRALRAPSSADVAGAMVAASGAALMKNEGTIWCALLLPLVALALVTAHGWSGRTRRRLAWLALPATILLAWKHVQAGLTPQIYIRAPTSAQWMRLPEVLPRLAAAWWRSLLDVDRWGLLGIVLVGACTVGVLRQLRPVRARCARVLLALVLLGQFCAVLLGVMLLEIQKGGFDNWMAHAWDRLILQLVPSALLLAVVLNARDRAGTLTAR